ncbi:MAG: hypothetical protein Kow0075_09600 [Salibacteraceae bacterium]
MRTLYLVIGVLLTVHGFTQQTRPVNGVRDDRPGKFVFYNATLCSEPGVCIDSAVLIVEQGKVVAVGPNLTVPEDAVQINCWGRYIYPSFIEPYFPISTGKDKTKEQPKPAEKAVHTYWNDAIRPRQEPVVAIPLEKKLQTDLLASGIGLVNAFRNDGIVRGTSKVINVGGQLVETSLVSDRAALHLSLSKGSSTNDYPTSLMGAFALIRQVMYDARWYSECQQREEKNPDLETLGELLHLPVFFEATDALDVRSILSIKREFDLQLVIKGSGNEYLLNPWLLNQTQFVLPLAFPKAIDVSDPFDARSVSYQQLSHWEWAPHNPAVLNNHGVVFSLSRDTLKKPNEYIDALHKVALAGLDHDALLASLTTTPAKQLNLPETYGRLVPGAEANFFITPEKLGTKGFAVIEHWCRGKKVFGTDDLTELIEGKYSVVVDSIELELELVRKQPTGLEVKVVSSAGGTISAGTIETDGRLVTLVLFSDKARKKPVMRLSGTVNLAGSVIDGRGQDASGRWLEWGAIKNRQKLNRADSTRIDSLQPGMMWTEVWKTVYSSSLPQEYVITNARIWTGDGHRIENGSIWVKNGKIKQIAENILIPEGMKRVNAAGKHITPGIVDEHSHIAIRGASTSGPGHRALKFALPM